MRIVPKLLIAAGLGFACATVSYSADEKPAPAAPDKPADWSKFTNVTEITGTVTKVDDSGFTLRVSYIGLKPGTGGGTTGKSRPKPSQQTHDYVLKYAENGVLRQLKLPPKTDDKGKKVEYTIRELEDAKKPAGMPYYAASKGDLQIGSTVEAHLIRAKDIPAAKATEADLLVKYAVIQAVGSTGTAPTDPKKKN